MFYQSLAQKLLQVWLCLFPVGNRFEHKVNIPGRFLKNIFLLNSGDRSQKKKKKKRSDNRSQVASLVRIIIEIIISRISIFRTANNVGSCNPALQG